MLSIQQIRFFLAIIDHGNHISRAAEALQSSQPALSRGLGEMEKALGHPLFYRKGKSLSGLTEAGQRLLTRARNIETDFKGIREDFDELSTPDEGVLRIATTHTQARYVLPEVIAAFRDKYPRVQIHLHQGSPQQIARWVDEGEAEFGIATEALEHFDNLILLPCYQWNRCAIVSKNHPLAHQKDLTLETIARHPLITYVFGFTGRSVLDEAFRSRGLTPEVILTALDADIIKTYVKMGMGLGIIASQAYAEAQDTGLKAYDISKYFKPSVTCIAFRKNFTFRPFMYEFIGLFAPHFDRKKVEHFHKYGTVMNEKQLARLPRK